jgi:hypothetical protein
VEMVKDVWNDPGLHHIIGAQRRLGGETHFFKIESKGGQRKSVFKDMMDLTRLKRLLKVL